MNNFQGMSAKLNTRIYPKVTLPLKLRDQCLARSVDELERISQVCKKSKEKKVVRKYLQENVEQVLLQEILERAVDVCNVEHALKILDVLNPVLLGKDRLDLIGSTRSEFRAAGRLRFTVGPCFGSVLNSDQLSQILLWSSPAHLKQLSFAADDIGTSNLPKILAEAHSLTKLVILMVADDNILRTVGLNCPSLRFLDVSFSRNVTDAGFKGLLLKPTSKRTSKTTARNPCADSLVSIQLFGTRFSPQGIRLICKEINDGYGIEQLTSMRVFALKNTKLSKMHKSEWTSTTAEEALNFCLHKVLKIHPEGVIVESLKGVGDVKLVFCMVIYRAVVMMCRFEGDQITTLVLSMNIHLPLLGPGEFNSVDVAILGRSLPNLRYLRGTLRNDAICLQDDPAQYLMPRLQVVSADMCPDSSVVLFMLRYAPALKSLRIHFNHEYYGEDVNLKLTDESVKRCLEEKQENEKNLEEILIKPSEFLTNRTLLRLVNCFPKLERVGDLDSWEKISERNIADFNQYLDAKNSQCVLSLVDCPASKQDLIEYNNPLNFMNY